LLPKTPKPLTQFSKMILKKNGRKIKTTWCFYSSSIKRRHR